MFKAAYQSRRALMPIDGFFEWKDIFRHGQEQTALCRRDEVGRAVRPWRRSGSRDPASGDNIRTFTLLTCEPNPLMATIHIRMPVILTPEDYMTWLTTPTRNIS
ncbi:SOS response-associated peptidase [Mesorhizobium sp. M1307]|uniref:SOS response-associated peptidase family protein n=1 Tax=Mesorhizobium sp. M1307 TaxID=2957079 RepID=UPI003335FAF3